MSKSLNVPTSLAERFADLAQTLDELAEQAVAGIAVPEEGRDPTFGRFGALAGFVRAAANVEGSVLEAGLRIVLDHDGSFTLMPADFRLPIIEAAQAAVRSNDKTALVALRLDPRVYAPDHYTRDLVAVRQPDGIGYLLELKRATSSYGRIALERLEEKMMAAALVTRDTLMADRRRLMVSRVEVAIIDCSDADKRDGVIGLSGLDEHVGCFGVADTLRHLRSRFAFHVQSKLSRMSATGHGDGADDDPASDTDPRDPYAFAHGVKDAFAVEPVAISFARKRRAPAQARA